MKITRYNNFDLIRLFAALQVAMVHAYEHLEPASPVLTAVVSVLRFFPGVPIFFTISGFLIFNSFASNSNIPVYFRNRLFRIYPALWFCLIFTICILISTRHVGITNVISAQFISWILAQLSFFQFYTPQMLRGFGTGNPNGSLWTISIELCFYVFVPFFYFLTRKNNKKNLYILLFFVASVVCNALLRSKYYSPNQSSVVKLEIVSLAPFLFYFLIGAFVFVNWDRINKWYIGKGLWWLVVYILYVGVFATWLQKFSISYFSNLYGFISTLLLSQAVIALAYSKVGLSDKLLKKNDISYGIYLFHMPIVNLFIALGYVNNIVYYVLALIFTLIMAIISWKAIERPILKLKKRSEKSKSYTYVS